MQIVVIWKNWPLKVFIRVYRLRIQSFTLLFSTQLCELLPLSSSFWFNRPPPFYVYEEVYSIHMYTYTVCKGGYGVLDTQTDKHPPQSLFTCEFF